MTNVIIHYLAGSAGDMFSYPLITSGQWRTPVAKHEITGAGRMLATLCPDFINCFDMQSDMHFYGRDWTQDHQVLRHLEPWLILVTDTQQVRLLKTIYPQTYIASINYDAQGFDFVLDSFCRKVLDHPGYLIDTAAGVRFLDAAAKTPEQREWFLIHQKQGQLGKWYRQQRRAGSVSFPPDTYNLDICDLSVDVRDLWSWTGIVQAYQEFQTKTGIDVDIQAFYPVYSCWRRLQNLVDQ